MSRSVPTDGPTPSEFSGRHSRGPHNPPRAIAVRNEHERIQMAAVQTIAEHGYEASTLEDICAEARVSEETFHAHFADKQEVALTAAEMGVDQVMLDCREAFRAASSWPEAIWEGSAVYLDWMSCEPACARFAVVELPTAGPPALDLLQSIMDAFAMFLDPGYQLAGADAPPQHLIEEAVANSVFGLLHDHIERNGAETIATVLPELVRRILTPFLGSEAANKFVAQRSARESGRSS